MGRPGKKIGYRVVSLDGNRQYSAELRYGQMTKLFYAYWKDELVSAETENALYPLLKALVAKHEILRFEYYISIDVEASVDDYRGMHGAHGHGVGMVAVDEDAQLYQLSLIFKVVAVAQNELEAGAERIHYRDVTERADGTFKMDERIGDARREDMNTWVKYTPERLATLKQVRRGMVQLHNKMVGIFGEGEAAAKFLDAPRGLLLLPGKQAK